MADRDDVAGMTLLGDRGVVPTLFGLSPDESLGEILFGLIMVLTFTLGAGIAAGESDEAARTLILEAAGCNIAWGVIDAVFYVMGQAFVRSRRSRLLEGFRTAPDRPSAIAIVRGELDDQLAPITTSEDREHLYERIHDALKMAPAPPLGIHWSDLKGALGVFLLVSLTAVPAALPFLFIDDPWSALRVSNGLLVGLLFFVGFRWAGYTQASPWKAGLGLMLMGVILVAIAIALGG
jgi:hypothetical protein